MRERNITRQCDKYKGLIRFLWRNCPRTGGHVATTRRRGLAASSDWGLTLGKSATTPQGSFPGLPEAIMGRGLQTAHSRQHPQRPYFNWPGVAAEVFFSRSSDGEKVQSRSRARRQRLQQRLQHHCSIKGTREAKAPCPEGDASPTTACRRRSQFLMVSCMKRTAVLPNQC